MYPNADVFRTFHGFFVIEKDGEKPAYLMTPEGKAKRFVYGSEVKHLKSVLPQVWIDGLVLPEDPEADIRFAQQKKRVA